MPPRFRTGGTLRAIVFAMPNAVAFGLSRATALMRTRRRTSWPPPLLPRAVPVAIATGAGVRRMVAQRVAARVAARAAVARVVAARAAVAAGPALVLAVRASE